MFVEIKHPHGSRYEGIESRLLEALRRNDLVGSAVVISFDAASLRTLHELEPELATGYLIGGAIETGDLKERLGITYLSPHYSRVDKASAERVRQAGLKLSVWTVDDESAMEAMRDLGCDAITTNRPEVLLRHLDAQDGALVVPPR